MNWVSFIGLAGIGQCFLMASKYLLGKRNQQQFLLISLFVVLGLYLLHETLAFNQLIIHYNWLYGWGPLFPMLIAPILYLYIKSLIDANYRLKWKSLLHLIPFFIAIYSRLDLFLMSSTAKKERLIALFDNFIASSQRDFVFDWSQFWHFVFWHLQPIVYFGLIVVIIQKAKERTYSSKKLTAWLKILAIGMFLYFLTDYITEISLPSSIGIRKPIVGIPLFSFYVFGICLSIITQSSGNFVINPITDDHLTRKEVDRYFEKLEQLMEVHKPYLNPELQLSDLAKSLGLPGRELSQVIKNNISLTYTDYVNQYRVAFSETLLKDPKFQVYTMSAIGEESGFKSKDVFYRAFKKFNNTTPKVFLDNLGSPNS